MAVNTYGLAFQTIADLVDIAGALPGTTVIIAGGERAEDLRLVESARDHGIVDRVMLTGDRTRIERAVAEVGIDIRSEDIFAVDGDERAAATAAELVAAGKVDIVLKGKISTPIINRALLPLAQRRTVSLVTAFDAAPIAGGRPMVMTDAGVTTKCTFERMQDLISNAVEVTQAAMGIERPRVAILSANEKQIPSLASTGLAAELTELEWPSAIVYGPLSFDLATDPASVQIKGLPSHPLAEQVAGRADILVCPSIDAANVLYKSISAMNKYGIASLANVTVGFPVPYIILSRADTLETRLESIALSCIVHHNQKQHLL